MADMGEAMIMTETDEKRIKADLHAHICTHVNNENYELAIPMLWQLLKKKCNDFKCLTLK